MKNILCLFFALMLFVSDVFSQKKPEEIKDLCLRVLDFDATKTDSIFFYANQIEKDSKIIDYTEGVCYSYRLRGIANELLGKYQDASRFYLTGLKYAEGKKSDLGKLLMLSDLGSLNVLLKQFSKAKKYFEEALVLAQNEKPQPKPKRLSSFYQNLGICYRNLKQIDSALINYNKALEIKRQIGDSAGIANIGINLSTLLILHKRDFEQAKKLLDFNVAYHTSKDAEDDLWDDYINLIGLHLSTKEYAKVKFFLESALKIAQKQNSPIKISDTYESYAEYYSQIGDYKNAFEYYQKYHAIEKELINTETNSAIEELETKYETEKKTTENKLLTQELETQKQRNLLWAALSIAVALAAAAIGWALWQNRKKNKILTEKNDFIQSQNKKLAELNQEKNNLISIVSHDLGSPFSGINLWSGILGKNKSLDTDGQEAVSNISKMAEYGQKMVQQILNIEKDETQGRSLNLEKINLVSAIKEVIEDFGPAANGKGIQIKFKSEKETVDYLTDKQYLTRILENLISNALKYSHRDGKVFIDLESGQEEIKIKIKDFGVGISKDDQRNLFSKYGQTSSKPTENEPSTGLGLHIVKRLLDELGGKISCESELGEGSTFSIILKN